MNYQEYKIPGTHNEVVNYEPIVQGMDTPITDSAFEMTYKMRQHMKEMLQSRDSRERLVERQAIIALHKTIEEVRDMKIESQIREARRKKLGSIIDALVYGARKSKAGATKLQEDVIWNNLVERESQIGGKILETSSDLENTFHYHDRNEWFWLCESKEGSSKQTVRYLIDENNGIYRSLDGNVFIEVAKNERLNLIDAINEYSKRVLTHIYGREDLSRQIA
jgi:hypothetical protein